MKWLVATFLQQYYNVQDNRSRTLGHGPVIWTADALLKNRRKWSNTESYFTALHANLPNVYIGVLSQAAACTELDFCKVIKILDQFHKWLKRSIKGCLWHNAAQNQSVDSMWTWPAFKHNVPSRSGKMTEKPGFKMQVSLRHRVRCILNDDNSEPEKIPWSIFRTNDKKQSTYRFPKEDACHD